MAIEKGKRAPYTLEFKLEAARLVQGDQSCALTAKILGISKQTLDNWVRQSAKGKWTGAGTKRGSAEQMDMARASSQWNECFERTDSHTESPLKQHGIKARGKRKFVVTTDSKHNLPIAPNLLNRNFQPEAPDCVWTSDITYIQTDEGWLYLTVILDLYSRQVVGWSMQPHMQTSLVSDALRMAWFRRRPERGLIFHSDRGSQYCSHAFQHTLAEYGMQSSMSRKGNCWECEAYPLGCNAPMESLWGSLKVGRLYGMRFETRRQAMDEVIDWLTYYNHKRLHLTLGYISPMQFEKNWFAAQLKKAA